MTATPEKWGAVIRSFRHPYEPALLWYISAENATLNLGKALEEVAEAAKVILDIAWIDGGLLLIVWATGSLDGLTQTFLDVAQKGQIQLIPLVN